MRRIGIDPGSAYIASTIVDGDVVPCAYVDAMTIEVGQMVLRDKPKHILLPDGSPRLNKDGVPIILTHRREMATDEELEAIAARLVAFSLSHGVTRAIVEEATDVHFDHAMGDAAKASMASALVRSGKVGAVVSLRLRDAGIVVVRVRHATWAGRIARSAGVKPKEVKPVITAAVTGWPTQSNEHERDAGGCAVWDIVVSAEEEAERNSPTPKRIRAYVHRGTAASVLAKRAAARAAKVAAGCSCHTRHARTCPFYKQVTKKCSKCGGPYRGHLRGLPCPPLPASGPTTH